MTVTRNEERSRFEIEVEGRTAFLDFKQDGNVLDLIHTNVPDELGGRGIAGQLAKGAMDYARENGLRVTPTCEYVQGWLERHPEEQDLVG